MHNLVLWYQQQISTAALKFDQAQFELVTELDQFLVNFARQNFITRLWRKDHKLGYYIYGDVGRGKSMLMNAMYQHTSTLRKTRLHFHEFMRSIHNQLASLTNQDNPLQLISQQLKHKWDIIYLDEMHISDIATAMILRQLLDAIFARSIYLVTSSNYHPEQLWPDGLMRERFLPAITLIQQRLHLASLNSQQDYRLLNNSFNQLYLTVSTTSQQQLQQLFNQINLHHPAQTATTLPICGRPIPFVARGQAIIWFEFEVLCGSFRSQLDYLELSQQFEWIVISNIYQLDPSAKDIARRFTWLIDILYDHKRKLILSSTVPIQYIYPSGDFALEFKRTVSRLEEMQTKEYLQKELTLTPSYAYNSALEN